MLLTDDQKRLFKQAVQKGIMPTKEELDSVKKSSVDYVNEKFKKLLFVLEATYEDIMNQYHVSRKRANGMVREFGFWKILALKGL